MISKCELGIYKQMLAKLIVYYIQWENKSVGLYRNCPDTLKFTKIVVFMFHLI